ncbi:MAG: 50S ribosomal protein L13 [Candidatus Omnitrophica bacterium]|nr:50S ribosomal protein L13 [Candidatus Omnitrophota bacterium]
MAKPKDKPETKWYLIDADGKVLGRLATRIATILMGKNRCEFTPNVDCGDHVVVINASKVRITGTNKAKQKIYTHYTGFMSGLRESSFEEMLAKKPTDVIKLAVKRMVPKNILGREMLKKLKVYAGPAHRHAAQKPEELAV